jgi:hypothetical protein
MYLMMDDVTPDEWGGNPLEKVDEAILITDDQINDSFDLIEAKAVIHSLEIACEHALKLRGLTAAINDPLALEGEKMEWRNRYKAIEDEIRSAIKKAEDFRRKNIRNKN